MTGRIVVLPGDGIGPEVTREAVGVLRAVARKYGHDFTFEEHPFGGASIDAHGVPLTPRTLEACKESSAVLLGAVGGPRWDAVAVDVRPERGLLGLRKELGVFANLRPVNVHPALAGASPLKEHLLKDIDLVVVRELTGGLYFGMPRFTREEGGTVKSVDTLEYTRIEIARVVDLAFRLAATRKRKVTSVDKANVLETSRLWRKTATEIAASHPGVTLEHMLVDTAAMRLVSAPASFDVVVTENMFGDILTDEASVLAGSMGMLPSASLGDGGPGLYEPIHGSAPDIAGHGIANPVGMILSAALLLRYSFGREEEACAVERAVYATITAGIRTPDLGGRQTTQEVGTRIVKELEHST
jgi:3-isopropylmalate dehydrogenase